MKTIELTRLLRRTVNEADEAPLTEAEWHLYATLRLAVMAYEGEVRLGHPPLEQRCMICEKPSSECYC